MIYPDDQGGWPWVNEPDPKKYKRYLRIAWAFKEFIVHDDIYSFLCVLTKHPMGAKQSVALQNSPWLYKTRCAWTIKGYETHKAKRRQA